MLAILVFNERGYRVALQLVAASERKQLYYERDACDHAAHLFYKAGYGRHRSARSEKIIDYQDSCAF